MSDSSSRSRTTRSAEEIVALPVQRSTAKPFAFLENETGAQEAANLRDYGHVLYRRRWVILLFFLIVVITTFISTFFATPIFRASATLQIDREAPKVIEFQDVTPLETSTDKDFYQTQYELLHSRSLAKQVIDQLNLSNHATFKNINNPSLIEQWLQPSSSNQISQDHHLQNLVDYYLKNLNIEPVKLSRLVRVHYESTDAQLAARIVNAIAENYIQMNLQRRFDASSYAKDFLEERLKQVKSRLEESEKKLVEFARKEQIIKIDDSKTITVQKLNEVSAAAAMAEQQRIDAEMAYGEVANSLGYNFRQALENPVIQQLKQNVAKLEAEYQDNLKIYKPTYPLMQQLDGQIKGTYVKINDEANAIRAAMQTSYAGAQRKEKLLLSSLNKLKEEVLTLQDRSIGYNIINREVDTNRQLYEGLLQRMKEVGVAGGVTANNISIVDMAEVPYQKYKPKTALNLLLALVLGLFGGIALGFLFEHLDDTVKRFEDFERKAGLSLLGLIPQVKIPQTKGVITSHAGMLTYAEPRSALAEAYRSVRTSLLFSTSSGAPKVMLFTSPGPGEGKTTSALNVAITFTQTGSKVLLVDTDLRNPSIHQIFDLPNVKGLTNYLAGDLKPADISNHTDIANLFVITSGPLPPNPAELLSSNKMTELLNLAKEKFDYVILDGPPVLGLADALILAHLASGTVVVVESGVTRQGQLIGALKRLRSAQAMVIGGVLSKLDENNNAYGQYQGYYYYQTSDSEPRNRLS